MTTTKFFEVSIPAITFKRTISDEATGEVEQYDEAIDAARVSVPFGIDKADAITKALHLHRRNYGIPASHHIMATARTVSLVIGTTTRSASGTARVPKALAR